jgi:hypothetical protein
MAPRVRYRRAPQETVGPFGFDGVGVAMMTTEQQDQMSRIEGELGDIKALLVRLIESLAEDGEGEDQPSFTLDGHAAGRARDNRQGL